MAELPDKIESRLRRGAPGECWEWTGFISPTGYGKLTYRPLGQQQAHRIVYSILVGQIPGGLTLDHLCRNRACVNPEHLEPVTLGVNTLRGEAPSAKNARKTHCPKGHELSGENIYKSRGKGRQCRTCTKAAAQRKRDEHPEIVAVEKREWLAKWKSENREEYLRRAREATRRYRERKRASMVAGG